MASDRRAAAVADAGNVLNVEENKKRAEQARNMADLFDQQSGLKGGVSDTIKRHAAALATAKTKKEKEHVKQRVIEDIRIALAGFGDASQDRGAGKETQPLEADRRGGGAGGTEFPPSPGTGEVNRSRHEAPAFVRRYMVDENGDHHDEESGEYTSPGGTNEGEQKEFETPSNLPDSVAMVDASHHPKPASRREAIELGNKLRGEYANDHTGWQIKVFADAIKDSVYRHSRDFRAILAIPELLKHAVLFRSEISTRADQPKVKKVHFMYAPLVLDGVHHLARLTVLERHDGDRLISEARLRNVAAIKKRRA